MHSNKFSKLVIVSSAVLSLLSACGGGGGSAGTGADTASTSTPAKGATTSSVTQPRAGDTVKPIVIPPVTTPGTATPAPTATSPAVAGIAYPFGSHKTAYVAGIVPTSATQAAQDAHLRARYDAWKSGVSARCGGNVVNFSNTAYATVSEGMGYGMLMTVLMAGHDAQARTLFDGLLKVVRSHPAYNTDPALMDWRINADCTSGGDGWNAMDGDLDIALALLMADKQWGSTGAFNYKAEGVKTINAIKARNMQPDGRTKGLPNGENNRTSDYMISHFKAFKRATGDAFWDSAVDKAFGLLNAMQANYAPNTGLIPDFIINTGTNPAPSNGYIGDGNAFEGFYYWNACRLPWRLATDYVTSGDTRSKVVLTKLMNFFNSSTGGNPAMIKSGYKLDGTVIGDYANASFIGPATAGAMVDAKFQPFLNSLWTYSAANSATSYFDNELQFLSLAVASGNWWNP